jgi:hypothetical protein
MFFVCCFSFSLGSYSTCLQIVSVVNTTISLSLLLVLLFDAPPSPAALSTSAWRCFFGSCFRKTTTICFAGFCGLNISRLYRSSRHRLQIYYAVRSLLQFCSVVGAAEHHHHQPAVVVLVFVLCMLLFSSFSKSSSLPSLSSLP